MIINSTFSEFSTWIRLDIMDSMSITISNNSQPLLDNINMKKVQKSNVTKRMFNCMIIETY